MTLSGRKLKRPELKRTMKVGSFGVVLVDMQPYFLECINPDEMKSMIDAQVEVLETCRSEDYPVVVLEYTHEHKDIESTIVELGEIVERIPRFKLILKEDNDGYCDDLERTLDDWGILNLCFMGINAPSCVMETAKSALDNGFNIITARQLFAAQTDRQFEFKGSLMWYREHTTFFENYSGLVGLM